MMYVFWFLSGTLLNIHFSNKSNIKKGHFKGQFGRMFKKNGIKLAISYKIISAASTFSLTEVC